MFYLNRRKVWMELQVITDDLVVEAIMEAIIMVDQMIVIVSMGLTHNGPQSNSVMRSDLLHYKLILKLGSP